MLHQISFQIILFYLLNIYHKILHFCNRDAFFRVKAYGDATERLSELADQIYTTASTDYNNKKYSAIFCCIAFSIPFIRNRSSISRNCCIKNLLTCLEKSTFIEFKIYRCCFKKTDGTFIIDEKEYNCPLIIQQINDNLN